MTPGPWKSQERMDRRGYTVERPTGQVVAICGNPSDARAIAETPAMVEALKEAVIITRGIFALSGCGNSELGQVYRDYIARVTAILARIEGRE